VLDFDMRGWKRDSLLKLASICARLERDLFDDQLFTQTEQTIDGVGQTLIAGIVLNLLRVQ